MMQNTDDIKGIERTELAKDQYVMSIDMGTTHMKCGVFDSCGRMADLKMAPTPARSDGMGTIYVPEQLMTILTEMIFELLDRYPGVRTIAITGMSEAGLIFNIKKHCPVTPILPWFDLRTQTYSAAMDDGAMEARFYTTGLRNSYKYGIYKFLWLAGHYPVDRDHALWLSVTDYIAWALTGCLATTPTFAARTYAYDIYNGCWDVDYLHGFGLSPDHMPTVIPEGQPVGYLQSGGYVSTLSPAAHMDSRPTDITVCIAGHDHVCAAVALQGGQTPGICNSVGTAETYLGFLERRSLTPRDYGSGLIFGPAPIPGKFFWMANIPSSGKSLEWLRSRLGNLDYTEVNRLVESLPPGPTGLLYYPFLSGAGTPLFDAGASAALMGIRDSHTNAHLLKGILEGLNYFGRYLLSLTPEDPLAHRRLYCGGGAAYSRPWMEIKAAITGCTVCLSKVSEATLLGAAALSLTPSCRKIFLSDVNTQTWSVPPPPALSGMYDAVYEDQYVPLLHALYKL